MTEAIRIEGLKEFVKSVKKIDSNLPKKLRLVLNQLSDEVIKDAEPGIPVLTGKAVKSIRPKSTQQKVRVAAGSKRVPYYGWLDFGGKVGLHGSVRRPYSAEGRYLYPAYYRLRDSGRMVEMLEKGLQELVESAGLEVD